MKGQQENSPEYEEDTQRIGALSARKLSTGTDAPASPGYLQVLDFTVKPCRTTLGTTRIKVFIAFVCMGWREKQMRLKL